MSVATDLENTILTDLANEAHRKFPSDGKRAGDWFERKVHEALEDEDQREEIVRQLVKDSRRCRVGDQRHGEFQKLKGTRRTHIEGPMARGAQAITECAIGLLDWYVYGRKLRDYVGIDLIEIAQTELDKSRGTARNAMFFKMVADFAGNQLVGDVASEKLLKDMMQKCQKSDPMAHVNGHGKNGNRG